MMCSDVRIPLIDEQKLSSPSFFILSSNSLICAYFHPHLISLCWLILLMISKMHREPIMGRKMKRGSELNEGSSAGLIRLKLKVSNDSFGVVNMVGNYKPTNG